MGRQEVRGPPIQRTHGLRFGWLRCSARYVSAWLFSLRAKHRGAAVACLAHTARRSLKRRPPHAREFTLGTRTGAHFHGACIYSTAVQGGAAVPQASLRVFA
jgi:hypothetical protein